MDWYIDLAFAILFRLLKQVTQNSTMKQEYFNALIKLRDKLNQEFPVEVVPENK